ncbi:hypothetical protein ILUMI_17007 [Ignelater luminosus]|uniref:Uncharacterized protein n=1 Tax=Ignelater luminosus TaxID=2038154 RepID=A0A8K0CQ76_IGNLU|nr:hypothetical protein ILUMI_17007 [Ignelater luminosus]
MAGQKKGSVWINYHEIKGGKWLRAKCMRPKPKRRTSAILSETLEILLPEDTDTSLAEDGDEEGDLIMLKSSSDKEPWMPSSLD